MTKKDHIANGEAASRFIPPPGLVFLNPNPRPVMMIVDIGSRNFKVATFTEGDFFSTLKGDDAIFLAKGGHESLEKAANNLRRIRDLMDVIGDARIFITEAGRNMTPDQIKYLEEAAGRRIRVLSGEEEANYNRTAILAEIKHTNSIQDHTEMFAAIGGGSLQMGYLIQNQEQAHLSSIPQGIQYLMRNSRNAINHGTHIFREALKPLDYEAYGLRAAGGVWREIGKLIDTHGRIVNYESTAHRPIAVSRKDMLKELDFFLDIGQKSLYRLGEKKRGHDEIVFGAMTMKEIIVRYEIQEIYISHANTRQAAALDNNFYDFISQAAQRFSVPARSTPERPALG